MKPLPIAADDTDDMLFHYGAAQWVKIRRSLRNIGVDADTVTLQNGKTQCSLRDELEQLAQDYSISEVRILTARQFADKIAKRRDKIAAVRDLFAPKDWVAFVIGEARAAEVHRLLTVIEAELPVKTKEVICGLELHEGKPLNAAKPALRDYLLRLTEVWNEVAGETEPRHRNRFVHACAVPVVPKLSIKNVRDFLSDKKAKATH